MSRLILFAGWAAIVLATTFGPLRAAGLGDDNSFGASVEDSFRTAVQAVNARDYNRAIRLLAEVVSDQPRNADALNYMGYSQRQLGDFDSAVRFYTRALLIDPDHRGANEYLGEAYLALHQLAKAETHLARLHRVCGSGCEEYRDLAAAVVAYKADQAPRRDLPR
jgi:tetratricopeptide (TPR) repeat protein